MHISLNLSIEYLHIFHFAPVCKNDELCQQIRNISRTSINEKARKILLQVVGARESNKENRTWRSKIKVLESSSSKVIQSRTITSFCTTKITNQITITIFCMAKTTNQVTVASFSTYLIRGNTD